MQVNEIIVSAGRTVSHPLESYANLRPQVTLKAALAEGDDFAACCRELQAKAEGLVEDHKNALIQNIKDIDMMERKQRQIAQLECRIRDSQTELEQLRRNDAIGQLPFDTQGTDELP